MNKNLEILPALAVRGITPIPNNDIKIEVGRNNSISAIDSAESNFGDYVILLVQKEADKETINQNDLLEVGVLCKILNKYRLPNNNLRIKFHTINRVSVINYVQEKPCFMVQFENFNTIFGLQEEQNALMNLIKNAFNQDVKPYFPNYDELLRLFDLAVSNEEICDKIAFSLNVKEIDKKKYLLEDDLNKRMQTLLNDLEFAKKINEIENKINESVKQSIDESQKEYYLREKMRAIQTELGDKAKRDSEIEEMRKKILASKMPKKIEEKALDELRRYQETPAMMADSQILKNYIDFLIELPWHEETKDNDDLSKVKESLDKYHYGLAKVKERVLEYLAVKIMTKQNPSTILCLVGPPGVGKTSLAMSIAEALGRKCIKQSVGGVRDESEIRGHRRTYVGALPGRILKGMHDAKTINPVFIIDEIDKMASDFKGDPTSAMLEVLDPEQNKAFSDNYVEEPYDLSQVLFIATANYLENIPAALRDRMEIIELSSYTRYEKFQIARDYLVDLQLKQHGITSEQFSITDEAIFHIIEKFTMEAGVRELNRNIASLVRKAIKEILVKHVEKVEITEDNLNEYLGRDRFTLNKTHEFDSVGIVTGLAYTEYGGDTLDVEATYFKGHGGLQLTGKLGEVMKESAQAAYSYVRAHAMDYGIDSSLFEENDIHIHIPEGAIPKDGPSAGVTLATAIVSVLSGKKVRRSVGMTGEITLRGAILPIGGLREKSIAAHRNGLTKILIPYENIPDIEDIPDEVKKSLEIIPLKEVSEVIKEAIIF